MAKKKTAAKKAKAKSASKPAEVPVAGVIAPEVSPEPTEPISSSHVASSDRDSLKDEVSKPESKASLEESEKKHDPIETQNELLANEPQDNEASHEPVKQDRETSPQPTQQSTQPTQSGKPTETPITPKPALPAHSRVAESILRPASPLMDLPQRPHTSMASSRLRPVSVQSPASSSVEFRPSNSGNIKVVVRVRPLVEREVKAKSSVVVKMNSAQETVLLPPTQATVGSSVQKLAARSGEPRTFCFDRSFWSVDSSDPNYASQETLYDSIGNEFLDHNLEGYHTCMFAYGQTGSGKSYTMMGNPDDANSMGLIPRTCNDLFERLNAMIDENVSCTVRLSYFEIYNEQVRDLLAPRPTGNAVSSKLRVRESPTDGPYVEGLSEFSVKSAEQVLKYLGQGNRNRSTAATKMNDVSSRSHAVFTLTVKQVHFHPDNDTTEEKVSQIRLVDLAGSERATTSGATGIRLREGSNINQSLTTLGRVIAALSASDAVGATSPNKKSSLVPYRDSVLTWLLKESLGGNSKTAMIACISPTDYDETLSTLRYADQAKKIRTKAIINQDIVSGAERDKLVEDMQQQINDLQLSLLKQQEDEQHKQELVKVRRAIRFYEDRALDEESKRRAVTTQKEAVVRHNKLLTEHLKEVTQLNQLPPRHTVKDDSNQFADIHREFESLRTELASFKQSLSGSKENWQAILDSYN